MKHEEETAADDEEDEADDEDDEDEAGEDLLNTQMTRRMKKTTRTRYLINYMRIRRRTRKMTKTRKRIRVTPARVTRMMSDGRRLPVVGGRRQLPGWRLS